MKKRDNLLGERGGDRGGVKSDDGENDWSAINHSILSGSYGWIRVG